ncbi:MAG TPA: cupin domain-containing protein [Chromatiaceae bacterium]|nr:cupin domain-containing protein [Chromatiaceae bacterium]
MESRLVIGRSRTEWELHHGPFDESYFTALPERNWTLLLQDVDKYLPEVARLLQPFNFLPRWRFDDVMISYAAPGGSVGPHIDTYDVFLVQGLGTRRWRIHSSPASEDLLPDLPVRILAEFQHEKEWLLKQGDVLYLPPGVAHWGIAESECMTWSVGVRDPSTQELLDSFAQFLIERIPQTEHYRDPPFMPSAPSSAISSEFVTRTFADLDRWFRDDELRRRWFGCFVTEVKGHLDMEPRKPPVSENEIRMLLEQGSRLIRHPFSRFAWSEMEGGKRLLFACGEAFEVPGLSPELLETLCSASQLDDSSLESCLAEPDCRQLLAELLNLGYLVIDP